MSLRPMTTARDPAIATPERSSSSMTPAGVHEANHYYTEEEPERVG